MPHVRAMNIRLFLCPALLVALGGLGCRDAGTRKDNLLKRESTVSLNLVGDPAEAFRKVDLFITEVEVRDGQTWKVLSRPQRAVDLQNPGGKEETLAHGVQLPRGDYQELRLKVDPARSSVQPREGGTLPLHLPPALREGIVLKAATSGSDNLIHDYVLNVDAGRSLFRRQEAAEGYTLALAGRLLDRRSMGVMTGRILDAQSRPLAGVEVMAQAGETDGRTLVRTVRTAQDGTFNLDLLPMGEMHYAVAQPRTGGTVYEARASAGFRPTALDRRRDVDLGLFEAVAGQAGPEGAVRGAQAPDQFDEVDLLKELPTGTRQGLFILRSLRAVAAAGSPASAFRFEDVPPGPCQVRARRATLQALAEGPAWSLVGLHGAEVRAGAPRPRLEF